MTVVFVVVLIIASVGYNYLTNEYRPDGKVEIVENTESPSDSKTTEPDEGKKLAPDFTVIDSKGEQVSFSDFKGKPIIMNFWATWCGYCVREFPAFQNVYDEYKDKIHFMMINVTDGNQETMENAKEFIGKSGYSFPVFYDTELFPSAIYGANSIPITVLIDSDGYYLGTHRGAMDEETLAIYAEQLTSLK